jgi:hypothetical protein
MMEPAVERLKCNRSILVPTRTIPAPGTHSRRLTTHRRSPQRHRSRPAHAAGQAQTLRRVAAPGERAVEMTEPENPQNQEREFSGSLESAKNKGALSTFPPPRLRLLHFLRIQPRKELSSATIPPLRSGSSFDWKRLQRIADVARPAGSYPETGLGEIDGDVLEADFWPGIISG